MANLSPDPPTLKAPLAASCRDVELAGVEASPSSGQAQCHSEPSLPADWRRKNIRANIAFQFMMSLAWGTAMGPVFDKYLFLLGSGLAKGPRLIPAMHANSLVGVAESVSGLTSLVVAIPVGYTVDRQPNKRARLARMSSSLAVISVLSGFIAVLTDELLILTVMLVSFGAFMELSSSATDAIFADSIPAGERSAYYVTKSVLTTVGSACGPGISALGLAMLGDKWQPYQIKIVIVGGLLLFIPTLLPLFVFHDPVLTETSTSEGGASADAPAPAEEGSGAGTSTTASTAEEEAAAPPTVAEEPRCLCFRSKHVPVLLALADFITCIGAGMTVKFFNLFFIQDHQFSPAAISLLQTAYPLVIALFMKFTERLAKPLGRPQASLSFFSANVLCLFLLGEVTWLPFLLVIFMVRGGFANSTFPIDRSILMDYTPSTQRGMWNAIQSLTSMTWSGSAFLGGLLSDSHDYRYTFVITSLIYACACVVYTPLLWLVPRKEKDAASVRS
ncbi:APA1 [Symbiodinium sp. KB8]|nr:APA1 [Symbiodinium sp. KB8]